MDITLVIIKGPPSEVMAIVRKLRKQGLVDGKDFGFGQAANGHAFWFKEKCWADYAEKHNTLLRLKWT